MGCQDTGEEASDEIPLLHVARRAGGIRRADIAFRAGRRPGGEDRLGRPRPARALENDPRHAARAARGRHRARTDSGTDRGAAGGAVEPRVQRARRRPRLLQRVLVRVGQGGQPDGDDRRPARRARAAEAGRPATRKRAAGGPECAGRGAPHLARHVGLRPLHNPLGSAGAADQLQQQLEHPPDPRLRRDLPGDDPRRAHHPAGRPAAHRRRYPPVAGRRPRPLGRRHAGHRDHQLQRQEQLQRVAGRPAPGRADPAR